jgi:hypothetical protein
MPLDESLTIQSKCLGLVEKVGQLGVLQKKGAGNGSLYCLMRADIKSRGPQGCKPPPNP